jgi:hypothetical protein
VQHLGLIALYETDVSCRQQVRQLMALAFAPLAILRHTFMHFNAASDQRPAQLFAYFDNEWMQTIPLALWNVHGADIRTNNDVEGWHNRFRNVVASHRPNIWRLLLALRQEQASTEIVLQQIAAGQRVHKSLPVYKKIRKQLRRLLRGFQSEQLNVLQYIDGVSYNLAQYS